MLIICYLDMLMTRQEHRKHLKNQYCFESDSIWCQTQKKAADMLMGSEKKWRGIKNCWKKWKAKCTLELGAGLGLVLGYLLSSNSEQLLDIIFSMWRCHGCLHQPGSDGGGYVLCHVHPRTSCADFFSLETISSEAFKHWKLASCNSVKTCFLKPWRS